jgi:hypothetical protein
MPNSNSIVTDIVTINIESFINTTSINTSNYSVLYITFSILHKPVQPLYCGEISIKKPIVKLI